MIPTSKNCVVVCGVVVTRIRNGHEEILLSVRKDVGFGEGTYALPGGKLREGETLEACAVRELYEETNLHLIRSQPLPLFHSRIDSNKPDKVVFFTAGIALAWDGEIVNHEPESHSDWSWYRLHDLPRPIMGTTQLAIDHYRRRDWRDFGWDELYRKLEDYYRSKCLKQ